LAQDGLTSANTVRIDQYTDLIGLFAMASFETQSIMFGMAMLLVVSSAVNTCGVMSGETHCVEQDEDVESISLLQTSSDASRGSSPLSVPRRALGMSENDGYASRAPQTQLPSEESVVTCATEEDKAQARIWASGSSSCTDSGGLSVLEGWTRGWAGGYCLLDGVPSWRDPVMSTADGVMIHDGEYCTTAGLVDLPNKESILTNITAITELTQQMCSSEGVQGILETYPLSEVMSADATVAARIADFREMQEEDRPPLFTPELSLMKTAGQCQNQMHSCMVHFCMSNFCRLSDGRIGMACQCGDQWGLNPTA